MKSRIVGVAVAALTLAILSSSAPAQTRKSGVDWPSFRGPNASGIAEGYATPTAWNVEKNENVAWKTPLPGLGHGSPVIWGDKLFVSTAISGKENAELRVGLYGDIAPVNDDTEHQWKVYCLDRKTGKILWEKTAHKGVPKVKRHTKATQANSTLATDGKHVVAFFGSEGLYCYDMSGKLLWKKDLGVLDAGYYVVPSAQWGTASSPILYKDRVLLQCDVQKEPFLAAFALKDGKQLWRAKREDVPTWGSPTVYMKDGKPVIAVNGWKHIGGYDVETGRELWKLRGGGDIPVPTPVVAHDLIYITNAHGFMAPIYAIKCSATGDISLDAGQLNNQGVAWSYARDGGYMQTPLVYGDYLYVCRDNGVLGCYEAKTGKKIYQERLGTGRTGFTASGVAADGKLYYTSEEGDIFVLRAGPQFEVLSQNSMGEVCMATPAISEGSLFFRTQGHVVAIREKK